MQLTLRIGLHIGSFDMKVSRVQECGSMDMTKYGHSQTGKIKSKYHFFLFYILSKVLWIDFYNAKQLLYISNLHSLTTFSLCTHTTGPWG